MQAKKTEYLEEFAARLRANMKRKPMTLQQIAEACGVAVSTVGAWTQAKNWPQVEVQPRLAQALGLSVSFLIHGITEKLESPSEEESGAAVERLRDDAWQRFNYIIAAAKDDPRRLGWVVEQMGIHLRKPDSWEEPETHEQIARRLGLPTMGLSRSGSETGSHSIHAATPQQKSGAA